jgi:hypothetical protein
MFELIERLRQKPERAKKRIAFLTSLTFCGIISLVWLSVVFPDIKSSKEINDKVANVGSSPSSAFTETLTQGFSAIGAQINKIKEATSIFDSGTMYVSTSSKEASSTTISE